MMGLVFCFFNGLLFGGGVLGGFWGVLLVVVGCFVLFGCLWDFLLLCWFVCLIMIVCLGLL